MTPAPATPPDHQAAGRATSRPSHRQLRSVAGVLTGTYADELINKAPEWAKLKHVEKDVVAEVALKIEQEGPTEEESNSTGHWVHNVEKVHDYWPGEVTDHVRFLAVVEEYCPLGGLGPNNPSKAVLLGSPVYVFKIG